MNNATVLAVLALGLYCVRAGAQEKVIRLYEGPAPGSENWQQEEKTNRSKLWQTRVVFNVVNPTLTVFQATESKANHIRFFSRKIDKASGESSGVNLGESQRCG